MLHRACAIDLVTYCKDVPPGEGRSKDGVFCVFFFNSMYSHFNNFMHLYLLGLKCLLTMKAQTGLKLDSKCIEMLHSRTQLFASAAKVNADLHLSLTTSKYQMQYLFFIFEYYFQALRMESVNDLVEQISLSPAKNFFLVLGFSLIGAILLLGVFCGRISKRHVAAKNK